MIKLKGSTPFVRDPKKCECGRDGCPVDFVPKNGQQKWATPECNDYVQGRNTAIRQRGQEKKAPPLPRYREASAEWKETRRPAIIAKYGVRRDAAQDR